TQGYRHTPAIDTSKALMTALSQTTEFQFDITEDLSQLNNETLANYDLLFFANATLRVDGAGSSDAATGGGLMGSWRTYEVNLDTPQGAMQGRIALDGSPESLRGQIQFGSFPPSPLIDVNLDGSTLAFNFNAGDYGVMSVEATLEDNTFDGKMTGAGGAPLPLPGTLLTEPDQQTQAAEPEEQEGVTEAQLTAMMNFLRAGKGIVGAHSALDALYESDDYRAMVGGGLFESHPWTQPVTIIVEEGDNPAMQHLGSSFSIHDEIYVLDANPRWNSRVLASLDMSSVEVQGDPAGPERNDYPISWIRNHNGGRVFMTKLGHFPDVWQTPAYLQHLLQGMRMAAGRIPADFSGHRVKEVLSENVWPDDIAVDEMGNVWIAELRGKVHRYDATSGETQQIAHLQTTDPTKIEHGLYGIEVDPNFYEGEPYVYLYYAEPETFINTLSRYTYADGQLDLASEEMLLRVPTEPQCCHQAGDIEWGPDGTLYLSTGDTGMSETRPDWEISEERIEAFKEREGLKDIHWSRLVDSERSAQNLQDLRGKILRINKDGTIPKDNPFFGEPGIRWEIYTYGLRNPYRFKVDQQTGVLYVGVVGPDASFDYDEYNISANGGENFGWPRTLGKLFFNEWTPDKIANYNPPLWEYTYETGGRSASVGPIYRHTGPGAFPDIFQNKIILSDWARRWIKWVDVEDATFVSDTAEDVRQQVPVIELPAKRFTQIKQFDQLAETAPISIELGPDGSIYVAEFDGFWDAGPNSKVTRYRWVTGNEDPIGEATFETVPGQPRTIQFDGSRSYDPNVDPITFTWDFGDGATSTEAQPTHTYANADQYDVRLVVTDTNGATSKPLVLAIEIPGQEDLAETSAPAAPSSDSEQR
ncbi:MAG TPA: ThuA domain-containing protein, partial [Rhodothermales bacterium]|nr:ThuA domain-containing protein [Rhodothermales bacterium]